MCACVPRRMDDACSKRARFGRAKCNCLIVVAETLSSVRELVAKYQQQQ